MKKMNKIAESLLEATVAGCEGSDCIDPADMSWSHGDVENAFVGGLHGFKNPDDGMRFIISKLTREEAIALYNKTLASQGREAAKKDANDRGAKYSSDPRYKASWQ